MLSKKTQKNIDNLMYHKINKLINFNNLQYIKNDIFEDLRQNYKLDFNNHEHNDIYNYLYNQIINSNTFRKMQTIEEIQDNLQNKFNKFIDKNYIKKIFMEIKRNKY